MGRREEKREETLRRITDVAFDLFLAHGYDATTLDAIAAAAGISRRTFFSYFRSKEDVLLATDMDDFINAVAEAFAAPTTAPTPMALVRERLPALVTRFETPQARAVDTLMRSTEALRQSKQAWYLRLEDRLYASLATHWPPSPRLRMAAVVAVGALRVAMDRWREDPEPQAIGVYLAEGLAAVS